MNRIYADNAATTRMSKSAVDVMMWYLSEVYGNPSSLHREGQAASKALNKARRDIAKALGADKNEIYFTSSGTESDNQALLTGAEIGARNGKKHIISQKTEHHAVLNFLKKLEKYGFEIKLLDVDGEGNITPGQVEKAIRKDTALVTIMTANNEIGTIMPVKEIAEVCRKKGVLFHTDAVQAVGHIPINIHEIGCDMLSLSAHKFRGAKGVGALYVRKGLTPAVLVEGGGQERGRRSGTENVAGICSMAAALKESVIGMNKNLREIIKMQDRLIDGLSEIPRSCLNGSRINRLPGNVNMSFEGIPGENLILALDVKGICASAGSACASSSLEPSHVITAIGRPPELAFGTVRFTISEENTMEEIEYIIDTVKELVKFCRACKMKI